MRWIRAPALLSLLFILAAACTGAGNSSPSPTSSGLSLPHGGTLRVRFLLDVPGFDPAIYSFGDWELFRCCLARTLLSYNGRPTDEGGADLHPDLATAMPDVSGDGLTWTFHLKSDLHYGPPFNGTEIVASDVIRALEREADPDVGSGYAFYYSVIRGFDDYAAGKASSISGLQAPNDHTLKVSLTQPTGDLGYRLSLPAAAPIPPGAADGHDGDYGRFLVSSGPYTLEGSGDLDFSRPPKKQTPVSGYTPPEFNKKHHYAIGGSATLVRNPSWDPDSDALRGAYPNRIQIELGPPGRVDTQSYVETEFPQQMRRALNSVRRGELDLVADAPPPPDALDRMLSDTRLSSLAHVDQAVAVDFIAMNVAATPFDDIHVRKAFYLALDRGSLRRASEGLAEPVYGEIPNHIVPDAMEDALLVPWRPHWVPPDASRNLAAAR
jgi:peptide/nickel transport system substrate-binding protein